MKIPCPYCGRTFPNIDTLNAHIASAHPETGATEPPVLEEPRETFVPPTEEFDIDEWLYELTAGEGALPPAAPERGFWPWETPTGEGFLWPWEEAAPAVEEGMPEGYWASPFDVPPEISAVYDIVYDPSTMTWRVGGTKAGAGVGVPTTRWETISEGGWDYLVGYDANGNITAREPLGRTETAEMSDYERERLALEKENLGADIKLAQQQLEQQRAIAQMQYGGTMTDYQAAQLGLSWEQLAAQRAWQAGQLGISQEQLAAQQQQALWGQQFQEQQFGLTQEQFAAQQAQQAQQWGLTQEQWQAQQAQQAQQWGLTQEQFAAQQQQALWGQSFQEQQLTQQQLEAQRQYELARLPYGQMTAAQQAQLGLSQEQFAAQQAQIAQQFGLTQEQWAWQQQQAAQQFGLTQEQWLHEQEQARLAREQQLWGRGITEQQMAQQMQLSMLPYEQMTAAQQAQLGLSQQQLAQQLQLAQLPYGQMTAYQQEQARLAQMPYEQMTAAQEAQLGLSQQQLAQQMQMAQLPYQQMTAYQQAQTAQQERAYGAQLAAQPQSWLQYAAFTGEQPAVQPWMLPLMPQEYQQLGAGQAIPGYTAESMAGMPQLTTPSRQYQARMGPTAMAQYGGYRQARTGERPEETQFRLWSGAPPSGYHGGLSRAR